MFDSLISYLFFLCINNLLKRYHFKNNFMSNSKAGMGQTDREHPNNQELKLKLTKLSVNV